jgi:hypothetical protein
MNGATFGNVEEDAGCGASVVVELSVAAVDAFWLLAFWLLVLRANQIRVLTIGDKNAKTAKP